MFVVAGVLAFAPVTKAQQGRSSSAMARTALAVARLAYYLCTRAVLDLVDWTSQACGAGRCSLDDRADALDIVRGLLSPTGLVSLAVRSLRDLGRLGRE